MGATYPPNKYPMEKVTVVAQQKPMTAPTPSSEEMLALADSIAKQNFNSCDLYCERPFFLIVHALRLAAKPADDVREATLARCAKIAEPWPGFWLDENSTDVDRAVVAVRTEIAETIRALSTTQEPKRSPSEDREVAHEDCLNCRCKPHERCKP